MSWVTLFSFLVPTLKIVLAQVDPNTPAGKLAALALLLLNQISPSAMAVHGPDHKFGLALPHSMPTAPYTEESLKEWAESQPND